MKQVRSNLKFGSTIHLELDIENTGLDYKTAGNLSVYPKNSKENILKMLNLLGIKDQNSWLWIEEDPKNTKKAKFPCKQKIKVYDYLANCDFTGIINKKILKAIAPFC